MLAVGIPVLTLMKANLAALVEVPPSSAAKFALDRKSTRLNSSHQIISYAVFCLKKKKPSHHSDATEPLGRPTRLRKRHLDDRAGHEQAAQRQVRHHISCHPQLSSHDPPRSLIHV